MATHVTPPVGDSEDDLTNTSVEHDDTEVVDATVDGSADNDDDQQDDDGDDSPNYGLAVRETGVARQGNKGLSVSHRSQELYRDDNPGGTGKGKNTSSGSLPPDPKLVERAYDITKAGVKDRILKAGYEETLVYADMAPVKRVFDMKGGLPVHPDLQRCFDKLVPFLAHVTEQMPGTPYILEPGQSVPPMWSNVVVDKVSIKDTGVVISGFRKLKGNRQFVLNSPFIDFNTDRDSWYSKAGEVEQLINELKAEVVLALEGKAFNPQYSLFEEDKQKAA